MDDPVTQIRDVVKSITEPYQASVICENVDKYFTEDAYTPSFSKTARMCSW